MTTSLTQFWMRKTVLCVSQKFSKENNFYSSLRGSARFKKKVLKKTLEILDSKNFQINKTHPFKYKLIRKRLPLSVSSLWIQSIQNDDRLNIVGICRHRPENFCVDKTWLNKIVFLEFYPGSMIENPGLTLLSLFTILIKRLT